VRQFEVGEYRSFKDIVQGLQVQPPSGLVRSFIFTGPSASGHGHTVAVGVDSLSLVPLVEAIGMRLKYCLEHSLERPADSLFEGDLILDALQLLKVLSRIMEAFKEVGEPVSDTNLLMIERAWNELGAIAEEVLQSWEDAGV